MPEPRDVTTSGSRDAATTAPDGAATTGAPRPRVVATDLDGTLLHSDGSLSERSRLALRGVEDAGVHVLFVTARPPRWLIGLADAIGGHGHVICLGGAGVFEVATSRVSEVHAFGETALRGVVADLRRAVPGIAFGLEGPDGPSFDPRFSAEEDHVVPEAPRVPVEELLDRPVGKLLARHRELPDEELFAAVEATVGDRATLAFSGAPGLAEMTAPGVTKASALEHWCSTRGIDASDVWAFGDMPNDLPMMRWAGRSIAVANAHPDVLAAATATTASNDDDGVARALEALLPGARVRR